jgi:hypothetical protein
MKKLLSIALMASAAIMISLTGCNKEGPAGANGKDGSNGTNGLDANETCKLCHTATVVDRVSTEFQMSKHETGVVAEEEAGNTGCTPCHCQEAFKYVCANNVSTVFVADSLGVYSNPYATSAGTAYGAIGCFTCHSSLHTTYGYSDVSSLTTVAAVPMTMWGGAQTINLTQDGGKSNLCVKCHQPRPFTNSNTNKNVLDYNALVSNPTAMFYDSAQAVNVLKPGYRTHTHYGTVGAIFAGKGGVEFPGLSYTSSAHATEVSCQQCHMAAIKGTAGGHSFYAKGNFNGCAVCHPDVNNTSQDAGYWTDPRTEIQGLLNSLAAKLKVNGIDILNRNPDATSNLWVGLTTNKYDGYLNIYDPINNPDGITNNAAGGGTFKNHGSTSGWTTAQKATNNSLPKITLTNAQMGAIINFQLCLREFSLGIHNFKYTKALLTNSIAILP